MNLPTGTVTFLFTDIEGSTRLWEEHPEAMHVALACHDALLRQAIEANDGYVFKTIGDAFCAAFATATEALAAALAAQSALVSEPWQTPLALRVRMALHTGAAEHRDNDYFGQPLNRIARLLAIGHGGQVLVSAGTQELTRDTLPKNCRLLDAGEHRLRDLGRPEPVFQLLHPALPSEFPPLRSLDNPELPNNLPQQITSFIGREKEIKTVKMLLGKTRLLTLTGSGGCGKTRLSLQVAAETLEQYPQGVWLVELAPLTDPALVDPSVAQALHVGEMPGKTALQALVDFLKTRRLLLVLDNCEHLLTACARLATDLLRACPHLQILASSREGLGIAGEQTYRVPSLSLPDPKHVQTVESLSQYEAAHLFIDRALAVQPQFTVTNANAPALAQLCVRLDGIPLALELAAARMRALSVEEINNRLDNRFRLLTGGNRTALPRQQTLRALIDWSYDLLNAQEKTLLACLSVFAGGWTLEAAEIVAVGPNIEEWEVLDLLSSLVDKSLVATEQENQSTRYLLLETVRQYARDRLVETGDAAAVRERHQAFCVAFAEEAALHVKTPAAALWLARLEREHDNMRAALEWGAAQTDLDPIHAIAPVQIAGALSWFWFIRGYYSEGRKWLEHTLATAPPTAPPSSRMHALIGAGAVTYYQRDYTAAQGWYEQGLALARELNDVEAIAAALLTLGVISELHGDFAAAEATYNQVLTISQELNNRTNIASALNYLGAIAMTRGDFSAARLLLERSLAVFEEAGNTFDRGRPLINLGRVFWYQGDLGAAQVTFQKCLEFSRTLKDKSLSALALYSLGDIARGQGDYAAASPLCQQSVALFREMGDKEGLAYSLIALCLVTQANGEPVRARAHCEESLLLRQGTMDKRGIAQSLETFAVLACEPEPSERAPRLWGAAEALREAFACPMGPFQRERHEKRVADARRSLGEVAFAAAWEIGRTQTLEQAIGFALESASALLFMTSTTTTTTS